MEISRLNYLITIAEERSLSRAAERLFVTPSTLSQFITNEEERVGLPLFEKTRDRWVPTRYGSEYIQTAGKILALNGELESKFKNYKNRIRPVLTVGLTPGRTDSFCYVSPRLKEEFPELELRAMEAPWSIQKKLLENDRIDIAVNALENPVQQIPSALSFSVLTTEVMSLFVPRTHPAAVRVLKESPVSGGSGRPHAELKTFAEDGFIMFSVGSTLHQLTMKLCRSAGFIPNTLVECVNFASMVNLAQKGIGVALIPSSHAFHSTEQALVFEPVPSVGRKIIIATKKGCTINLFMQRYQELLKEYYLEPLPARLTL